MSAPAEIEIPSVAEFDAMEFATATRTIRTWVSHGTVAAPRLVAELRYWLKSLGG